MAEKYNLCNEQGSCTAKVDVFMKMSCFGPNLQTTFQIKTGAESVEYIFRQRNLSNTFTVKKSANICVSGPGDFSPVYRYEDERNQPLIAPLYSGIDGIQSAPGSQINVMENVSLTQLFDRAKDGNVQFHNPQEGINSFK